MSGPLLVRTSKRRQRRGHRGGFPGRGSLGQIQPVMRCDGGAMVWRPLLGYRDLVWSLSSFVEQIVVLAFVFDSIEVKVRTRRKWMDIAFIYYCHLFPVMFQGPLVIISCICTCHCYSCIHPSSLAINPPFTCLLALPPTELMRARQAPSNASQKALPSKQHVKQARQEGQSKAREQSMLNLTGTSQFQSGQQETGSARPNTLR